MEDDDVVEDVEDDDVEYDDVKGRKMMMLRMMMLRRGSRNALGDFTRATLYGNLHEKYRHPRVSPERRHTHFARACACECTWR